jgi:hypothetical protein
MWGFGGANARRLASISVQIFPVLLVLTEVIWRISAGAEKCRLAY